MTNVLAVATNAPPGTSLLHDGDWRFAKAPEYTGFGYCFDVRLIEDKEVGGYTAYVAQLPSVISEGDNAAAALKNIEEAFRVVLETYQEDGVEIAWQDSSPLADDENEFRVVVHA